MDFELLQTHLHGMVVHFPIALLFISVAFEFLALRPLWRDHLRTASLLTLAGGTLGAVAAVLSGPEETADMFALGETHETLAKLTLIVFAILLAWRLTLLWRRRVLDQKLVALYLVLGCVGLGLLGYTGYLGGTMVYEQAAGVRTNGQLVVPVMHR